MAISEQVKESMNEAAANVREAISIASRTNEDPVVVSYLSRILIDIDRINTLEMEIESQKQTQEFFTQMFKRHMRDSE